MTEIKNGADTTKNGQHMLGIAIHPPTQQKDDQPEKADKEWEYGKDSRNHTNKCVYVGCAQKEAAKLAKKNDPCKFSSIFTANRRIFPKKCRVMRKN